MSAPPPIHRLITTVLHFDRGQRARLRRGASETEALLIPALGALLGVLEVEPVRRRYLATARIAAIVRPRENERRDEGDHPASALARTEFPERRMSRLLVSDGEVLEGRLLVAARFLASKREPCKIAPFFWFLEEAARATQHRVRAEWARRYGQEKNSQEQRERRGAPVATLT